MRNSENRKEDNVREEQDTLRKQQPDRDGERSAHRPFTSKKIVAQNPRCGSSPLVDTDADKDDEAGYDGAEYTSIDPWVLCAT